MRLTTAESDALLASVIAGWSGLSDWQRHEVYHRFILGLALARRRAWRYETPEPVIIGAERPFFQAEGGKEL